MINVSQQFKDESLKNRAFYVTAKCTLANGTVLNMEKGDFYNAGNGIVDSADSSDFPIGVAIEKTATLTLVNDDDRFSGYDFGGSRFVIYLNLQMSDRLETIKRGTFVTVKKPATSEKISLTLADHMYLADREYSSNLLFPATAGEVLRDACQTCGIMLGDASFNNDDYIIQEKPSSTTFRAVIGDIALLAGGNARIDEDDRLRILNFQEIDENLIDARTFTTVPKDNIDAGTFDNPSTDIIDAGTFREWSDIHILQFITGLQYDTDDVVVTGVQTTVDEENYFYGTDGYVLTFDSPFVSQSPEDALQRIGDIVIGLRMRPFSCQSIANAYATFMDAALVTDQKGRSYFTYITNIDFQFNGYTTFSNDAQSAEELNTEYYSGNSVIVEQSKKETEKLLSAYDIAVQNMNQLAANTLGFYYTQVVNEDGSITAYRHDKPLLSDSKIVYKSGIDGFFVTNDYQGTDDATSVAGKWSSGFDSNGDAVLNILYAIGIQADWINTRGLTAKDNEGNVTFRVNADDGSIEMVVKSFSLSGKTIEEIAQDNLSDYVNAVFDPAISNLQKQIDGQIESWFDDYIPTSDNAPANEWTTTSEKDKHLGDLFYIVENPELNGMGFRYALVNGEYKWEMIEDTQTLKALSEAAKALETAKGKIRNFTETPQPPYNVGDIWWTSSENGQGKIKVCVNSRESGTYVSSDWIDNSYVNSDDVNTAITQYDTSLGQTEVFNKLTNGGADQGIYIQDGKLYINANYILSGTLAGQRINGKGLYVYDNSGNTTLGIDSNGNVTIRANTFSLQGSTIKSIADSSASSYANSALSSAKRYTDSQLANFSPDVNLTQQEIFNILTNNGQTQGIYLSGGRIYINATYINTGYLADWEVRSTSLYASSGYNSVTLDGGNGRIRTTGDFEVYGGPGYAEMKGNRVYADLGKFYSLEIDGDASVRNLDASGRTRVYGLSSFFSGKRVIMDSDDNVTLALELSSSIRYKNHIRELTDEEANRILKIPIVWYTYKEQYISEKDRFYNKPVIGMYAEDVHKNIPEASQLNEDGTVEDWNYRVLIPLLIKEVQINDKIIKEQQKEIETLKSNQTKILQALSKAGIEVEL